MPVGIPYQGLFRFACASIALTILVVLGVAALGVWSAANDHALHDTYYATARTGQVAMVAAFAIPNQIGAVLCTILAVKRSGALAAGWVLAGSSLMLVGGQVLPIMVTSFVVRPQRYVDYAPAFAALRWTSDLAQYGAIAALIGMATGWLMLGFSSPRQMLAAGNDESR